MTKKEFEQKCAILAQTPQSRWFDLRFQTFVNMMNNSGIGMLNISYILPLAQMLNFVGHVFKIENQYYFLLANKQGNVYECFNVEKMDFDNLPNIIASSVLLSSDDDRDRAAFLPILMMASQIKSKGDLKRILDTQFERAIR